MPDETKPQIKSGLKFKSKPRDRDRDRDRNRSRSPKRSDRYREGPRDRPRDRYGDRYRDRREDNRDRDNRDGREDRERDERDDRRREEKRGRREKDSEHLGGEKSAGLEEGDKAVLDEKVDGEGGEQQGTLKEGKKMPKEKMPKEKEKTPKDKKLAAPKGNQEQMIIVTVNDRLGSKARIPCFASDSVRVFKAMVAAQIGRKPHEIMLKRQGERPFKDQLTLLDYGVSNGVQIDLELDTGD